MVQVIGVKFKRVGKTYYFSPNGTNPKVGDDVIVETARGVEYGRVAMAIKEVSENRIQTNNKKATIFLHILKNLLFHNK